MKKEKKVRALKSKIAKVEQSMAMDDQEIGALNKELSRLNGLVEKQKETIRQLEDYNKNELHDKYGQKFFNLVSKSKESGIISDLESIIIEITKDKAAADYLLKLIKSAAGTYAETKQGYDEHGAALDNYVHSEANKDIDTDNPHDFEQIRLENLVAIKGNIRGFKDAILKVVNIKGGMKQLSLKTNLSLPSLSRFFNSDAMPRRSTLIKIGEALNIHYVYVFVGEKENKI